MKKGTLQRLVSFAALCFVMVGVATIAPAQERQMGGVGITVFKDRNFRGSSATYTNEMSDLSRAGFNNNISSLRIGPGEQWEVCDQPNFRGTCVVVSGEESDLRRNNWNDRISSFRRVGGTPGPGPATPYIVLYTDTNFRGMPTNYGGPIANLNRNHRSVTIGRGVWEFCEGVNFSGRCVTIERSTPDLGTYNLSRRISSARPVDSYQPAPPQENWYVVVFSQQNYRGSPQNYDSEQSNINRRIGSITIGRGVWEVCSGRNFTGNCRTLNQSVANFGSLGMGTNIRSLRPVRPQPR